MDMIKHSQSTESNKFVIFLQYIKKEFRDGIHFLHADKHQADIIVFDGSNQTCPKYLKYFYCDAKHSDILRGSSYVRYYLLFVTLNEFLSAENGQ